jgi:hypothetical protein
VIPYNLACYACQMGQLATSRKWLQRALRSDKNDAIRKMAIQDEDLKPLRDEIRGM